MKRTILALITIILLGSCSITKSMWNKHYDEIFQAFLITKDGSQVVFLGENYHYIFDDQSNVVKKILFWPHRNILYIDPSQTYLKLDKDNNVSGSVVVRSIFGDLVREDSNYLASLGFAKDQDGSIFIKLPIYGKRYLANNIHYHTAFLNKEYVLEVKLNLTPTEKLARAAVTPITAAIDATLWLGKTMLIPVGSGATAF